MPDRKPTLTPLAILVFAALAAALIYIGSLALAQFSPKCVAGVCPTLFEMILRAIATFFAGMMVFAGIGWWIVFNLLPGRKDPTDERPSA